MDSITSVLATMLYCHGSTHTRHPARLSAAGPEGQHAGSVSSRALLQTDGTLHRGLEPELYSRLMGHSTEGWNQSSTPD
ncbi:hypothetical protein NHX12_013404 [Muraenolepis orangiensis]|uniref:Uncharacterized protein n=1 Tax=Muraenolepis orangiensis TaxID=630683 RepID=A0A9Q0DGB6_9TELE|nr:hypothetical protein NHX12_013404 [Muraenolepis orangiensis]